MTKTPSTCFSRIAAHELIEAVGVATPRSCEWGGCDADATTTVDYPAVVPGTAGKDRSWQQEIAPLHVCDDCAIEARAEVADTWPADMAGADAE